MTQSEQPDSDFLGKYENTGRIGQILVNRFFAAGQRLLGHRIRPGDKMLEVGCGPGYSTQRIKQWQPQASLVGSDISASLLRHATRLNPEISFVRESVYELNHEDKSFDVVFLMEVLEHLEEPKAALDELQRVARRHVLLSTPREPIWRFLNFMRGKYMGDWGNTPGHIQHWSSRGLIRQVSTHFHVEAVAKPLPWTILLLSPR